MGSERRVRLEVLVGLLLAAVAGIALAHLALQSALSRESRLARERSAIASTQALVDIVRAAGENGDAVRAAVRDWLRSNPSLKAIRIVSIENRSLEATTIAADLQEGEVPRRLVRAEKPLFDLGEQLRAAIETNAQEKSARKEEIDVVNQTDGSMTLSAPVERDADVVGLVQVMTAPPQAPARASLLPAVGAIAFAVLILAVVAFVIGDRRLPLVALALLLLGVSFVAYSRYALHQLADARKAGTAAIAQQSKANRAIAARVLGAISPQSAASIDEKRWDVDVFRRPYAAGAVKSNTLRSSIWGAAGIALLLLLLIGGGLITNALHAVSTNRTAFAYIAPAMIGMMLLVFFPFIYGISLSFTGQTIYNVNKPFTEIFTGLKNYGEIVGDFRIATHGADGWIFNYKNFYYTLLFTIAWTVTNVAIGTVVGLALALILNTKGLLLRPFYRVLLILPWAVPNYITALIWKGMFHQQFGVVNQIIQMFGGTAVSWFEKPFTSFVAVVATNGWLSFPFMMVVSLGALQSIPADLYEAARVDGASRWQQFRSITLPSLRPALIPAIILSVVWTFNMFNIIYLVSAGEPAGSTEILITQAYKIAFEQYRYGYAAAYSTVIFAILLIYGTWQNRVTRATEAA